MIEILKTELKIHKRRGRKDMFSSRPQIFLTKLPGDMAELQIDFCERWNLMSTGGGWRDDGLYEDIWIFDNQYEDEKKYDIFEIKIVFNKKVYIIGENCKRYWLGVVQSEASRNQVFNMKQKNMKVIEL